MLVCIASLFSDRVGSLGDDTNEHASTVGTTTMNVSVLWVGGNEICAFQMLSYEDLNP